MELTWVAILASVVMALGAACVFVFAVKRDYFHNIEDAKYQVFWSDLDEPDIRNSGPNIVLSKEKRDADGSRSGKPGGSG